MKKKPTIAELEKLLNSEQERDIRILPNGEIRSYKKRQTNNKPVTMKENLGGEYALL